MVVRNWAQNACCQGDKKRQGRKDSSLPGKPDTREQLLPLLPFGSDGVGSVPATRLRLLTLWRRGEDSNLRYPLRYTHFPGVRLKPDSATSPRSGSPSLCQSFFFGKWKIGRLCNFRTASRTMPPGILRALTRVVGPRPGSAPQAWRRTCGRPPCPGGRGPSSARIGWQSVRV